MQKETIVVPITHDFPIIIRLDRDKNDIQMGPFKLYQ